MRAALVLPLLVVLAVSGLVTACGQSDPVAAASCLCDAGRQGQTVWCEVEGTGWIGGKQVATKAEVDQELAREVAANAKAKGQSGDWIDAIVSDVALGTVKKKKCACESCAKGETEHDHDVTQDTKDKPGP